MGLYSRRLAERLLNSEEESVGMDVCLFLGKACGIVLDVCIYRPLSDLCVMRYVITSTTVDLNKTVWEVLTTQHADGHRRLPITP